MRRLRLRKGAIGLLLGGMNEIRKLDCVLNEEDGNVVADEVPISFLGVELHGRAAHIPREIGRALVAGHCREPHEGRGLFTGPLKQVSLGVGGKGVIGLEIAMRAVTAGMNHAFWNSLVIEMENLLAEMKIIHEKRPARTDPKGILVIRNRPALRGRQHGLVASGSLVQLASFSPNKLLVVDGSG
ncbi:hypothetical protein D3C80_1249070 [compost metagenome]